MQIRNSSGITIKLNNRTLKTITGIKTVFIFSSILSILVTYYLYSKNLILTYGDAESHLIIAKQVIHGLTPGFAQLGGIWLPIPHILLIPFVYFDFLWFSGLAGAIVSGFSYVVSCIFVYKLIYLLTKNIYSAFFGSFVFLLNPNILYLQSTPMTELPLIMFLTISIYYFVRYLKRQKIISLVISAFFGFLSTLTRYDGWFLVVFECIVLVIFLLKQNFYLYKKKDFEKHSLRIFRIKWLNNVLDIKQLYKKNSISRFSEFIDKTQGVTILFSTLAFFGIFLWLLWGYIILGDPLYFTNSQFSARSQQMGWYARGELPAYHNLPLAFLYYFLTSAETVGLLIFILSIFGSIIFLPSITPQSFEWDLFNVRYCVLMVLAVAIFLAILFNYIDFVKRVLLVSILCLYLYFFYTAKLPVIAFDDGVNGLSASRNPHAQYWLKDNYDNGLVLLDTYSRRISIVKSGLRMQNIIYI